MRKIVGIGLTGVILILAIMGWKNHQDLSGIPDAINSINSNGKVYLSVVLKKRDVEDEKAAAVKIIDMCRNNEFQTIKFSFDYGYPESLSISVFETRKAFEKNEEIFHIVYETEERMNAYNIVENPEQYQLYLNEEIIEYTPSDLGI